MEIQLAVDGDDHLVAVLERLLIALRATARLYVPNDAPIQEVIDDVEVELNRLKNHPRGEAVLRITVLNSGNGGESTCDEAGITRTH